MNHQLPILINGGEIDSFVKEQVTEGVWREEIVPAKVLGTPRDMKIYRSARKSNPVKHTWHGSTTTFCPPKWYDLGIGSGACGYGCRFCFLMLTFRSMRDPMSPVLYDNVDYFWAQVRSWLVAKDWKTDQKTPFGKKVHRNVRTSHDTLGLGIDCSDSLLFEGVTGHARELIPMFAKPESNPLGNKLILLTKSANVSYLDCQNVMNAPRTHRTAITFSLNPQREADLWEGFYSCHYCVEYQPRGLTCEVCKGTGYLNRITPSINDRLRNCFLAQRMGFETRWRLDPILTPENLPMGNWKDDYIDFFNQAAWIGCKPRYITLGTYRQKNAQLDSWRAAWGLPAPGWQPSSVEGDGTHEHLLLAERMQIYEIIIGLIAETKWPGGHRPRVELCKEPHTLRQALKIEGVSCNCLQ